MRSSKQQLKDELDQFFFQMTDPEEQAQERRKEERKQRLANLSKDHGL